MHIKYMINQHHYDKIKYYPHLIIKLKMYTLKKFMATFVF
jgi:hypothetical protein